MKRNLIVLGVCAALVLIVTLALVTGPGAPHDARTSNPQVVITADRKVIVASPAPNPHWTATFSFQSTNNLSLTAGTNK